MSFSTDPGQRREFICGLRELAAFCTPGAATRRWLPRSTGSPALLGVTPERGDHYTAARRFGPIEFEACAIPSAWRGEHDARRSYEDNITIPPAEPAPAA